nr:TetR/AcrR family transcriptional regulator [uncultured Clostridium sp.]
MFHSYNKVQRIVLETTLQLISEKELQATSMSLISKESGISTGSIYHYFKSKEDIINELYKGISKFHGEAVLEDFYTNKTVKERFYQTWEKVIQLNIKYAKSFQFIEQYSFSPYIDESTKQEAYKVSWCGPMTALYAEAISQRIFMNLDPKMMVQMNFGSLVYLIKAHFQNNVDFTDEIIQKVIHSCWNAVSINNDII